LASWEGLFSVTLFVIHCNDLTVIMFRMDKAAAVLSAVMKVYIIPCHDRGHISVVLALQSCTDSLHILPGSSGESHTSSNDGACNFSNIQVEDYVDVKEVGPIAINEEADIGIKEEEIPEDINFPDIKSEPDEVSYVCVCLLLGTIYQCPAMSVVFVMSVFLATCNSHNLVWLVGCVGGSALDGVFCK
jgi:hypothetical protein